MAFRTYFLICLGAFMLAASLCAGTAAAQQDSAAVRALLEERDREIKDLLGPEGTEYSEEQRQKLKDIINGVIDYRSMASYALQETWDTLSAGERDEFVELFSTIVREHSLNDLDIYRAEVEYRNITVKGDSAEVRTTVRRETARVPVVYRMYYEEENWVVTDISIDEVSTAESYRNQFQRIISRRGYDTLLESLRKRAGDG